MEAGRETTQHQWAVLETRLVQNYARMRENGVTIDENPPADVMAALRAAANTTIADWLERAGPEARALEGHSRR